MFLTVSQIMQLAGSPRRGDGYGADGSSVARDAAWTSALDASASGLAAAAFLASVAAFWLDTVITLRKEGVAASKKGTAAYQKDVAVVREAAAVLQRDAASLRKDAAGVLKGMAAILKAAAPCDVVVAGIRADAPGVSGAWLPLFFDRSTTPQEQSVRPFVQRATVSKA